MKLQILDRAYAKAEVNLINFKKDLSKHWDMEKAIKHNTSIKELRNKEVKIKDLKTLIWGALDWGGIMDCLKENHEEIMKVNFYLVKYSDWHRLCPGKMKGREVEFIEENKEGYDTLLIQSLDKNRNFDIKAFIKKGSFTYASTDKLKVAWCVE